MVPTVEESMLSIFTSASFLDSLPFTRTQGGIVDAALAPAEVFEGTYVRDAEEQELGLFRTQNDLANEGHPQNGQAESSKAAAARALLNERDERAKHRRSLLGRSTGAGASGSSLSRHTSNNTILNSAQSAWNFPKRSGPARTGPPDKATPLRKRRVVANNASTTQKNNNVTVDPEIYLKAARKLLKTYPLPRASEHVELLTSQYEGLLDSIADLEEALEEATPLLSTSGSLCASTSTATDDIAALQADIRREELEILALKEAKAELEKKVKSRNTAQTNLANGKTGQAAPAAAAASAKSRSTGAGLPKKMPSIPTSNKTGTRTTAKSSSGSNGSNTSSEGKRVPAVVARKLAEQKVLVEKSKTDSQTLNSSATPPRAPDSFTSRGIPEVQIQSPSIAQVDPVEGDDEDQTITIGTAARSELETENILEKQPKAEPRLPAEQMQKLLIKMSIALPSYKLSAPRDPEGMLSVLSEAITKSGTSGKATSSGNLGSPGSSSITPVNIIEIHLLHTFLSLLISLPPLEVADTAGGKASDQSTLNLILRDVTGAGSPASTAVNPSTRKQTQQEPLLNMNKLKAYLADKAKERGYNEDLGHKAIYGLVAKRVLKIDRKGREALVCFT